MTDVDKEIIISMAENGLNIQTTAKKLGYHYNSVYYHIDKIKRDTQLNPKDFYDMQKLLELAEGGECE